MKDVFTNAAPASVGPYAQAIISNGLVFCSGQIGLDPKSGELKGADIISQTSQAIFNLKAVIEAGGSNLQYVVKTTCYLTDLADYQKFNEIYNKYFVEQPARATVQVAKLPKDALVEIEAIAEVIV